MTFATNKRFLSNFLFEMDKLKHCVLPIFATSRALLFLEKKMTWIVGASGELACNFVFNGLNFRLRIDC